MTEFPKPGPKRKNSSMVKELDALLSLYVRTRDGFQCNKCGKSNHLGAAHVLPKGHYKRLRFEPDNLMTLCWMPCHESFWHKRIHEARAWFDEKYPGRYERLEIASRCAPKTDLKLLLCVWRQEVAKLGGGNG